MRVLLDQLLNVLLEPVQIKRGKDTMQTAGWVKAEWGISDYNRRAKYYALTRKGRAQLATSADSWRKLMTAVGLVMDMK